jgi:hypothetical protein
LSIRNFSSTAMIMKPRRKAGNWPIAWPMARPLTDSVTYGTATDRQRNPWHGHCKQNRNFNGRFSPYRAVNTLSLSYKNQSVNVV